MFGIDDLAAATLGAGVIGGLGNVVSGLFGSSAQSKANETNVMLAREGRDWQSVENQKARDFQERMWNAQNAYNTPANQRRLAQEAGYNPYLLTSSGLGSGAGSVGSAPMSGAPDVAKVSPVNPMSGLGAASDSFASMVRMLPQIEQVESNKVLQSAEVVSKYTDSIIKAYHELGYDGAQKVWNKVAPALQSIDLRGSRLDITFDQFMKDELSKRYNQDMQSLNLEFQYETAKKWTDKEKQNLFDNLAADSKNKLAHVGLMATQGELNKGELKRISSEIARNFAEAFSAQKVGEYYEVNAKQMEIINKMMDLQYQEQEADFAFNTDVRKYKKDITHRGVKLGLFLGDIGSQNVNQSIQGNKPLQYMRQVTQMVGDVFKVNFGASVNRTNFNNLNPDNHSKMFYSGDGYYMNNGLLMKGNW